MIHILMIGSTINWPCFVELLSHIWTKKIPDFGDLLIAPIRRGAMIAFHGTDSKKAITKIHENGFRPGTYFAHSPADALFFGGTYLFVAEFHDSSDYWKGEKDRWQFHLANWHGPENILASFQTSKVRINRCGELLSRAYIRKNFA